MHIDFIKTNYNAEVALIVLCCRKYLQTADNTSIQCYLQQHTIDWKIFYQLSAVHRVRPVIYKVLSQFKDYISSENLQEFRSFSMYFNAFALNNKRELNRILNLLKQNNILGNPFKGVEFAETVYGDIGLREFSDNDIIIKESDIDKLIGIMINEGYQSKDIEFYKRFPKQFIKDYKDLFFEKTNGDVREFAFEFHFKTTRDFQGYPYSFAQLLGNDYLKVDKYSNEDKLKLITISNGFSDLYPNMRSVLDVAVLLKQIPEINTIDSLLKTYVNYGKQLSFTLLKFPLKTISGLRKSEINFCNYLLKNILEMKEGKRYPFLKYMYFNIKNSNSLNQKISLMVKSIRLIVTPNINDLAALKLPFFSLYYITKPFRILLKKINGSMFTLNILIYGDNIL